MKRAFLMLGTCLSLSACLGLGEPAPSIIITRPNPDDAASRRVCDVDSLALQKQRMDIQSHMLRAGNSPVGVGGNSQGGFGGGFGSGAPGGAGGRQGGFGGRPGGMAGGGFDGQQQATPTPQGGSTPDGEVNLMNRFDAQIDAQYRAVTSSCRAYIQCMEMNNYDERACADARNEWSASQDRFLALSAELKGAVARGRGRPRRGGPDGNPAWIGGLTAGTDRPEWGD